jgi:hypothetical protein
MGILLAFFLWVTGMLAVIATAWIGIGDSAGTRLHLQHPAAIQRSYDSFVAADDRRTAPASALAAKAKAQPPRAKASVRRRIAAARRPARPHAPPRDFAFGAQPGGAPRYAFDGGMPLSDLH